LCRVTDVPVALLPVGTANNVASWLGLVNVGLEELVGRWKDGCVRRLDIGDAGGRCFVESVGGGLLAEAIALAKRQRAAEVEDQIALDLRRLRELVETVPARRWRLELDGSDRSADLVAVNAMLIGQLGPNVVLAADADPADGRLDVVLVGDDEREAVAAYLDARLGGHDPAPPALPTERAGVVRLQPPEGARLRIDDELHVLTVPVKVSCGVRQVRLLA